MLLVVTHTFEFLKPPKEWVRERKSLFGWFPTAVHGLKAATGRLEDVIGVEDELGIKSTIFVSPLHGVLEIADELKRLSREGWDIQLLYTPKPPDITGSFRIQRDALEIHVGNVYGVRIVGADVPSILEKISQEAVSFDSSLRSETFLKFDPVRLGGEILEMPIGLADEDIFICLGLRGNSALKYAVSKMEGALDMEAQTFLVDFRVELFSRTAGAFRSLVEEAKKRGVSFATCSSVLKDVREGKIKPSFA